MMYLFGGIVVLCIIGWIAFYRNAEGFLADYVSGFIVAPVVVSFILFVSHIVLLGFSAISLLMLLPLLVPMVELTKKTFAEHRYGVVWDKFDGTINQIAKDVFKKYNLDEIFKQCHVSGVYHDIDDHFNRWIPYDAKKLEVIVYIKPEEGVFDEIYPFKEEIRREVDEKLKTMFAKTLVHIEFDYRYLEKKKA